MERRKNRILLLFVVLSLVVSGCRSTKSPAEGSIKGNITLSELESMEAFAPAPASIYSKLKLKAEIGDKKLSTSGTLGIEEDKGVRIGITALGLFEIARLELTPTTAQIINKVDSEYASIDYSSIALLKQSGLGYNILQAILLNVPFSPDGATSVEALPTMRITREGNEVSLITPQKGSVQYTFYVDVTTGKLIKTQGLYNETVKVVCLYSDFTSIDGRSFPSNIRLEVEGLATPLKLYLQLGNIRFGNFTFKSTDTRSMERLEFNKLLDAIK